MTMQMLSRVLAHVLGPVPMHMGQLHAYEQFLVFGLAFGPFVVVGIVVFILRRRDVAEEEESPGQSG